MPKAAITEKAGPRQGTKILRCSCKNSWQDERYGRGKRGHNAMKRQSNAPQRYRCTCCEKVREG